MNFERPQGRISTHRGEGQAFEPFPLCGMLILRGICIYIQTAATKLLPESVKFIFGKAI